MKLTYTWSDRSGANMPAPGPGAVLVCVRRRDSRPTGTVYLILAARRVRRRDPVPGETRMAYQVERIDPDGYDPETTRAEQLVWMPR